VSQRFNARRSLIRESRSLILDYLNAVYPADMEESVLVEVMLSIPEPVTDEYVRRDLGYLKDRGLVADAWPEHPVRRTKLHRWRLTADGLSFIEADKPWDELEGGA